MDRLTWRRGPCAVLVLSATAAAAPAQTLTTLVNLIYSNGAYPMTALEQGIDGNLYGTTTFPDGTFFRLTLSGTLTTVYSFCADTGCSDGVGPRGITLLTGGNFLGAAFTGGSPGSYGTIFETTPGGTLTTLHTFHSTDGANPFGRLTPGPGGDYYGTTTAGGANGSGTVFKITPSGKLTTLYSFCAQAGCTDGADPIARLTPGTDGNFYGTTSSSGAGGGGTVFKITPGGTLTTLYSFCALPGCTDGATPGGGMYQAANGNFYGTTAWGGTGSYAYACQGCGTVFEITPGGALTTLHSFVETDGLEPEGDLILGTDGNLYGTTAEGGVNGGGTIFSMTLTGTLTTVYSFAPSLDGFFPRAGLTQATDGNFYGTTYWGGLNCCDFGYGTGTVFRLSMGLGPFVKMQPNSGKAGAVIEVLGTNLTGATRVAFNGVSAAFKVVSPSLITAAVPSGATTGEVEVATPGGALSSKVAFRVIK